MTGAACEVALFGMKRGQARRARDAAELALDLTPEAIVLYEREPGGLWRKFASAALDDPELPIVIGLLRSEAEAGRGKPRPVRLWLPPTQVLRYQAAISGATGHDRLRAGFEFIETGTVYRPKDVAIAVAPPDASGTSTILITYAATWNEARNYAARWGFQPGPVSTRHEAADFGDDGPAFQLKAALDAPPPPDRRPAFLVAAGLAAAAIAAGAWLVWPANETERPVAQGGGEVVAEARPAEPDPVATAAPASLDPIAPPGISAIEVPPSGSPPATPAQADPSLPAPPVHLADAPGPYPAPAPAPALPGPAAGLRDPADTEVRVALSGDRRPTTADSTPGLEARRAPMPPRAGPEPSAPPSPPPSPEAEAPVVPTPLPRPASIVRAAAIAAAMAPLPVPRPKQLARPATALPKLAAPSPPNIARGATLSGLPMDQTTFIGVISLHSGRKALLRLPDGTIRSVVVGDILDGWRVSAIGAQQMRISRNGKDKTLMLVSR